LGAKPAVDEKLLKRDFVTICTSNFLAYFSVYLIVPILPVFLEDQGYSNSLIGALMSMATVAALLRPLFGRFADRSGRKSVLIAGTLLLGVSTFFYASFSTALPLFLVRFLNGLGLAAFHTAAYAVIGDLAPSSRRLQAIAIFYISVDATIGTAPPLAKFIHDTWGYTAVYVIAGVVAMLAFLISLTVRETRSGEHLVASHIRRKLSVTSLQVAIFTTTMGFTLTIGALQTFVVLSCRERNITQEWLWFTVFAFTLIAYRLAVGRRADHWPRRPLIIISGVIALAGMAISAYAGHWAILALGTFVYALGTAYLPTTLSALLLDQTRVENRGAVLGIFMAVFDIGIGLGGVAMGPVADLWGYTTMYLVSGAIALCGLLFFIYRTRGLSAEP
jgi:predicted MFS family arabinose efflux permease